MRAELRPGLHASCMPVIREWDCSLLVWDMQDLTPSGYDAATGPFTACCSRMASAWWTR